MVSSFVLGLYELSSMMTSSPSVRTVLRSIVGRDSSGSQIHGFGTLHKIQIPLRRVQYQYAYDYCQHHPHVFVATQKC